MIIAAFTPVGVKLIKRGMLGNDDHRQALYASLTEAAHNIVEEYYACSDAFALRDAINMNTMCFFIDEQRRLGERKVLEMLQHELNQRQVKTSRKKKTQPVMEIINGT